MTIRVEIEVVDRDNDDTEEIEQEVIQALRSGGMNNFQKIRVFNVPTVRPLWEKA